MTQTISIPNTVLFAEEASDKHGGDHRPSELPSQDSVPRDSQDSGQRPSEEDTGQDGGPHHQQLQPAVQQERQL